MSRSNRVPQFRVLVGELQKVVNQGGRIPKDIYDFLSVFYTGDKGVQGYLSIRTAPADDDAVKEVIDRAIRGEGGSGLDISEPV